MVLKATLQEDGLLVVVLVVDIFENVQKIALRDFTSIREE